MAAFALLALFAYTVLAANNCSIAPIYVDYHARLVDGGLNYQYGLFMGIGTVSQNQSLWPSLLKNDTYFSSVNFCLSSKYNKCRNETHGYFSPALSQTYRNNDFQSLDTDAINGLSIEERGTDTLNIFTHYFDPSPPNVTFVQNFPVTVLTNDSSNSSPWFGPTGQLGLGPSSTLLKLLYDQGLISSRSFGLYTGTSYARAGGAINGSITLGGYDSGRWNGRLYDFDIAPVNSSSDGSTPFKVTVDSVTLLNADNSTWAQLNDAPFDAYLSTNQFPLSLPQAATTKFAGLAQGTPNTNPYDTTYSLPGNFKGSLSITLSTGLTVVIPNHDLKNDSNVSPISTLPQDGPTVPVLGSAILSYLYLIAKYDASPPSFHLAAASPSALYVQTQPLCPDTVPTPATTTTISSFASNGIIGAILGGVIGGIGITFTLWFCVRRHFQRKAHREFEASLPPEKRKVNKSKNPITAYMRETAALNSPPLHSAGATKPSFSSSLNDDGEGYEMQRTPPRQNRLYQQHVQQSRRQRQQQQQQPDVDYFSSGPVSPPYPQPRTSSPPPAFSTSVTSPPISPPSSPPPRQPFSPRHNNLYSNVPLTPNTPLPLLSGYGNGASREDLRSESPAPRRFGASPHHHQRTNSDDRRQQLGLTLKTTFEPPPKKAGKGVKEIKEAGRGLKVKKDKSGGNKGSALKKMFPAA